MTVAATATIAAMAIRLLIAGLRGLRSDLGGNDSSGFFRRHRRTGLIGGDRMHRPCMHMHGVRMPCIHMSGVDAMGGRCPGRQTQQQERRQDDGASRYGSPQGHSKNLYESAGSRNAFLARFD
jgi:hypothetical protein